ncbi:MAG TPA: CAP domain-containing protein [Bryobacteraceae bacterium]|nr:CAP domain-containing protein [Bryobacteraceae bacterium]
MRAGLLIALTFTIGGCGVPSVRFPRALYAAPPDFAAPDPLRVLTRQVFDKVNRQRRLHGLHELAWNAAVAAQARLQSSNMMEHGFFSHTDPLRGSLASRLNGAGIMWSRCAENIFREQGMDEPADEAVEGWMRSPAHRASILDPLFTQTGVGIAISADTEYFITQIFVRPGK